MKPFATRGFSLIELLIALLIGTTIIFGMGYAYQHQLRATTVHRELLRAQGDAHQVIQQIGADIRQAGFTGCQSNLARTTPKDKNEVIIHKPNDPNLSGFELAADTVLTMKKESGLPNDQKPSNVEPNSWILEVRYASANGASVLSAPLVIGMPSILKTTKKVEDASYPNAPVNVVLLSDCEGGVVLPVQNTPDPNTLQTDIELIAVNCGVSPSMVGADCVDWQSASVWPIRIVQYYLDNKKNLKRRIRKLANSPQTEWIDPDGEILLENVEKFDLVEAGVDGIPGLAPKWESTKVTNRLLLENLDSNWARVAYLSILLETRTKTSEVKAGPAGLGEYTYRRYTPYFSVRARAMPEKS